MSHRSDCPDPDDARRRGERDYEYGASNPYRRSDPWESWEDRDCRERAEREWQRGYERAEYRAEEEAEERRAEARARELRDEREYEAVVEEEAVAFVAPVQVNEDDLPF